MKNLRYHRDKGGESEWVLQHGSPSVEAGSGPLGGLVQGAPVAGPRMAAVGRVTAWWW
jgi:hypothetical protein